MRRMKMHLKNAQKEKEKPCQFKSLFSFNSKSFINNLKFGYTLPILVFGELY